MKPSPFDKLDKLLKRTVEPKGPEWFTAKEYSAHGGYSESSVRLLLTNLVKEGKIEMWNGLYMTKNGQRRRTSKYRMK